MTDPTAQPAGYYYAEGDPPNTQRYWDGAQWQGSPQPIDTSPLAGGGLASSLASPMNRVLGRLVDFVIWIVIFSASGLIIGGGFSFDDEPTFRMVLGSVIGGLLVCAYEIFMVGNRGATVGKMALGTKVVTTNGAQPDMLTATKRISPYLIGTVAGLVPVIGVLMNLVVFAIGVISLITIFTDSEHQALWDKIASTVVVSTK